MTSKSRSLPLFYIQLSLCSLFGCSCVRSSEAAELVVLALVDGTREGSLSDTMHSVLHCARLSMQGDKEPMSFLQPSFHRTAAFWQGTCAAATISLEG